MRMTVTLTQISLVLHHVHKSISTSMHAHMSTWWVIHVAQWRSILFTVTNVCYNNYLYSKCVRWWQIISEAIYILLRRLLHKIFQIVWDYLNQFRCKFGVTWPLLSIIQIALYAWAHWLMDTYVPFLHKWLTFLYIIIYQRK